MPVVGVLDANAILQDIAKWLTDGTIVDNALPSPRLEALAKLVAESISMTQCGGDDIIDGMPSTSSLAERQKKDEQRLCGGDKQQQMQERNGELIAAWLEGKPMPLNGLHQRRVELLDTLRRNPNKAVDDRLFICRSDDLGQGYLLLCRLTVSHHTSSTARQYYVISSPECLTPVYMVNLCSSVGQENQQMLMNVGLQAVQPLSQTNN